MFLPTKPYNEFLENYKKEPSIRIGKSVPKNAVNMAYYFNPTATDAEKVLCADAPRNTIDHRVEEIYRYLFDMPEADDDLFERTAIWSDEEGYSGILPRIWVKWHEKSHITEKNMQLDKTVIVDDKGDVPTFTDYQDDDGFEGNLFLDTVDYEVKDTKTEIKNTTLKMEVKDHELYKQNVENSQLNKYMKNPTLDSSSPWPKELTVKSDGVYDSTGKKWGSNPYDGYITTDEDGPLVCTNIEKDPLKWSTSGKPSYQETYGYISLYAKQVDSNPFTKTTFETDSDINTFITMMSTYECNGQNSKMGKALTKWKDGDATERAKFKIKIYRKDFEEKTISGENVSEGAGNYYLAGYNMIYTHISDNEDGIHNWNVYANYSGIVSKPYQEIKIYPTSWEAKCHYTGIIRKVWQTYDGIAYYKGSIIKGEGIGNVNPELNPDILMYPDDEGFLRRLDVNGNNYYKIEAEQFYITDVFKDNTACFYKYDLKYPIHDYRGPDDNGFYEGNAVKVYTNNLKNIPDDYKYQLKLYPAEYETQQEVIDGEIKEVQKVKKYNASLYTSFISKTTDTYKATYNAFVEFDTDEIINTNNGIDEDIYNKPFMIEGIDFNTVSVNKATRTNKIKILNPNIIDDTRRYITFEYQVTAYKRITGGAGGEKVFTSQKRQAQILNKEYAVESEYDKFIERSMIISPKEYDNYMSPFDIVIKDQALTGEEPIITSSNSHEFIFYCKPVEETLNSNFIGAINITCNPDGSGVLTAETTLDTGFYNESSGTYTKKLVINNPYIVENGKIYAGYMVKCLDVRNISVKAPREEHLLESWYPLIQFGHYSQVMDQYGTHTKVCYSMPEYDEQYWGKYGKPYVDIKKEQAEILNPHMIKVRNKPLHLREIQIDEDTYIYKNKIYKVFKEPKTWKEAQAYCELIGGNLAMPKTEELSDFIVSVATQYELQGLWLGATNEEEGIWKWVDGTTMVYSNWNTGEPNNSGGNEHYLETYTNNKAGKWNDLPNDVVSVISGFICEFDKINDIKVYRQKENDLFEVTIENVSFSEGIIITKDAISENDVILVDYTYLEEFYVYRGFNRNEMDFCRIDLNSNQYHTYSDLNKEPSELAPTKNLFNKTIYFYLRPTIRYQIDDENDDLINTDEELDRVLLQNKETLYHTIDKYEPESELDIYIGSVYIRQNTSLQSTILIDTRTRGGGVLEEMKDSLRKQLEPESDFYLDIGCYDGTPYQENAVIIVRLDNSILKEYGGRFTQTDIEEKVKKWLGAGIYPIIEYVDSYSKYDMPQYNLIVEDSYTNVINQIPELTLECINI
jgi:hypothetical protein